MRGIRLTSGGLLWLLWLLLLLPAEKTCPETCPKTWFVILRWLRVIVAEQASRRGCRVRRSKKTCGRALVVVIA